LQFAGKKFVETGVTGQFRAGRLGHVDPVAPHKPANQRGGDGPAAPPGDAPGQGGQRLFGQQVLQQHSKTFWHGGSKDNK